MLSSCVPMYKCAGLTHRLLLHVWHANPSKSGTSSLSRNDTRCANTMRSPSRMTPYPSALVAPDQSQHPSVYSTRLSHRSASGAGTHAAEQYTVVAISLRVPTNGVPHRLQFLVYLGFSRLSRALNVVDQGGGLVACKRFMIGNGRRPRYLRGHRPGTTPGDAGTEYWDRIDVSIV